MRGIMRYRKKPIEIEAIQWTGDNADELKAFTDGKFVKNPLVLSHSDLPPAYMIETPEGALSAIVGDYIIRGVAGEFYPCKPDIFAATYDCVCD